MVDKQVVDVEYMFNGMEESCIIGPFSAWGSPLSAQDVVRMDVVDFEGPDDPAHPLNWTARHKTIAITIISINALLSPVGSTISAAAAPAIMAELGGTSDALGALMTTIYLVGYAFGPFLIAPLSELYGKRIVFRVCAVLFCVFNIACALANTLPSLIAYRLLTGIAGSCPGTLGASSIADMIPRERRGTAMAAYVLGPTFGPTLGPIIGGNLTPVAGWRWGFWLMAIASGVVAVLLWAFVRESYPYAILKHKTARLRRETGDPTLRSALDKGDKTPRQLFAVAIMRPFKMLLSPVVFLQSAYAAVVYSYAYLCFTTFPRVFRDQYGFGSGAAGLASLGLGLGFLVGLVFCMLVSDRWAAYLARKYGATCAGGGIAKSEYRLPPMFVGAVLAPVGLFWYGWAAEARVHWIAPIMGTAVLGVGIVIIYSTSATYLVDAYSIYSASVMAASATLRCFTGALLPLAGPAMFDRLGVGWGNSVLGFIAIGFIPLPIVLYYQGERIRRQKIWFSY
ncbi:major facilitator superfamily domain-containing protein [Microdochium bolleyi]|uniref:Major facilitator superfamily domain-containing protein n=1 Tax=Microdochium bolleyi TaxID=196109 RepID=A0A136IJA7_9PEZI|nr:major facilitator superfamily domain-containing protein [Microdochium bolleyi]